MDFQVDVYRKVIWQLEWLVRLLKGSLDMGVVPMDWRGACIVPCTKGRVTNVTVATQEVLVCSPASVS